MDLILIQVGYDFVFFEYKRVFSFFLLYFPVTLIFLYIFFNLAF